MRNLDAELLRKQRLSIARKAAVVLIVVIGVLAVVFGERTFDYIDTIGKQQQTGNGTVIALTLLHPGEAEPDVE